MNYIENHYKKQNVTAMEMDAKYEVYGFMKNAAAKEYWTFLWKLVSSM